MSSAEINDQELESFRLEVRDWLEKNLPTSLKGKPVLMSEGPGPTDGDFLQWKKAMGQKGFGVPTWPKQYGGGGLSPAQARVLHQEMNRAGASNPIGGLGVMMFGPTLLESGSEEQKKKYIPGIASGEVIWCQGYSEPEAGSDLASLRMQCVDKGDHFLVNGQKTWTSAAQYAHMCFALVRTDNTKKHEGISFLLIDMKSPGVEVRPIKLISGDSPFCETFFTDVKVPKENLMGPLNGGWSIGKRLLQFERQGLSGVNPGARDFRPLEQIAKLYVGTNEKGEIADTDLRVRLTHHIMGMRAFMLTVQRSMMESKGNAGLSATTSIMKNAGTRLWQERSELLVEILGHQGLGWAGEGFAKEEIEALRGLLWSKAITIYGGTSEIQNNIIAKRVLGLPDPK